MNSEKRPYPKVQWLLILLAHCGIFAANDVRSCPFCGAASLTLAEQLSTADGAVLVQWSSGVKEEGEDKPGSTTYEVLKVLKGPETLKKGDKIEMPRYRGGKPGDLFLLLGTKGEQIEWGSPMEVTETSFNYVAMAPTPETPTAKRMAYYVKYLENPDQTIANDAFAEFANAPYKDVVAIKDQMSQENLRKWIQDKNVPPTRLGLYGMMLGLCGTPEDAQLLEAKITEKTDEFRLGIDGIMGGYLLLTKDSGLKVIEESKFVDPKVPFAETFAAMQAIRFMWTYADGVIPKERLRESMRMLLPRPELTDLVITDLARWKDWAVLDQLYAMYDKEEYNIPSIKRAIVRYYLVSSKDVPKEEGKEPGPHVAVAKKYLAQLREKDPKTVSDAERFFIAP